MTKASKPLAKSLHTVTVLVRLSVHLLHADNSLGSELAVHEALVILGLDASPDTYGLAAAAIRQIDANPSLLASYQDDAA